jgi:hypothetical protein
MGNGPYTVLRKRPFAEDESVCSKARSMGAMVKKPLDRMKKPSKSGNHNIRAPGFCSKSRKRMKVNRYEGS